jgi:hypothetical protein
LSRFGGFTSIYSVLALGSLWDPDQQGDTVLNFDEVLLMLLTFEFSLLTTNKPIGASPGRDNVLTMVWYVLQII